VPCTVELPEDPVEWSGDRATAVFRILQEALTNVARHADADRVEVRVVRSPERVRMEIRDDGKGITQEEVDTTKSFGLLGMEERARMFGGTLAVEAGEAGGTTVTVSMPY
jgi:signal transduction histidine kinase